MNLEKLYKEFGVELGPTIENLPAQIFVRNTGLDGVKMFVGMIYDKDSKLEDETLYHACEISVDKNDPEMQLTLDVKGESLGSMVQKSIWRKWGQQK